MWIIANHIGIISIIGALCMRIKPPGARPGRGQQALSRLLLTLAGASAGIP